MTLRKLARIGTWNHNGDTLAMIRSMAKVRQAAAPRIVQLVLRAESMGLSSADEHLRLDQR